MNRRRQDVASVRISDEEYSRLESKFEALKNEFAACRRKLDSKCEALLILSQELDQCRSERDQFKLMAEQLRERCQTMKRNLSGKPKQSTSDTGVMKNYTDTQSQNLARLLYESKEVNKSLKFEIDDLKQKLNDAQGDIKLLREQIARSRVGTTDEGMNTRHFPAHEREELVQKLESSNEQFLQLERDLQTVLDEKEELVTERDVYKTKYERLNQELNYILKGDENRVVDIDALVMENKYLQERLKQMEEEKSMAMAAVSKYKSLLERKKNKSSMKLGQSRGGGLIISQKQVQKVLDSKQSVLPTQQAMSDLQALAGALLDSVNDKNLALSHQRKTNKILGNRVAELEKKIKTLECAGLWNVPTSVSSSLEKLKQDYDEAKTLLPRKHSESDSDKLSVSDGDRESELETVTPLDSVDNSPMTSPHHVVKTTTHHTDVNDLDTDLDLLPTKEVSEVKPPHHFDGQDKFYFPHPEAQDLLRDSQQLLSQYAKSDNSENLRLSAEHAATKSDSADSPAIDSCAVVSDIVNNKAVVATETEREEFDIETATEVLEDDDEQGEINDSEDPPQSVLVYSQDKLDETGDNCSENIENAKSDAHGRVYTDRGEDGAEKLADDADEELDDFYNETKEGEAEKVGLLLESVAKKMCNISHNAAEANATGSDKHSASFHDINDSTDGDEGMKCRNRRKERERSLSGASERSLLARGDSSVEENLINNDEPHNVEC